MLGCVGEVATAHSDFDVLFGNVPGELCGLDS
jgi:hypothetical protein